MLMERWLCAGLDALLGVSLQDISNLEFVEAIKDNAAFVTAQHLAHVVFTTPQRGDFTIEYFSILAHYTHLRGARNFAIGDATACDHDILAGFEGLENLGVTVDDLVIGRFEHAGKRGLNIICELVDDIVIANINSLALCLALCRAIGLDIEADNDGPGSCCEVDIGFADIADTFVDQANLDVFVFLTQFRERVFDRLCGTLDIALENDVKFFDFALLHLQVEGIQIYLTGREILVTTPLGLLLSQHLGRALIRYHRQAITGMGHFG